MSFGTLLVGRMGSKEAREIPTMLRASLFSGRAASSRLRLFEVIPCHLIFVV